MYYNNRTAIAAYGQQQQQGNIGFRPMRQSPALQAPLPEFQAPVGARGQDIMIIWDFQNVRTPTELEPVDVIRFLYNTFVKQPGPRRCAGAFCTFTDNTKKAVGEKRFNQFCSNGVLNFMMINSPGGPRKADDSDHPLKEMMMNFTVDCVRGQKDGVLLLITADADFVRPAIWCKQQGCVSLELLYYGPIASKEIRQLEANWKMEWRDFLDCSVGRRCAWTFPYPQDVAAGLVPPGSSSSSIGGMTGSSSSSHGDREQWDHRTQQQQQQQQQQQVIAGYLPAPAQRLRLPAPGGATGSTTGGTAAALPVAVQVSNSHVHQAAQQLLQNPAALHQVVQQYKQSMQTTAVLQQVLQGVAQAAGGSATGSATAAAGCSANGARMHSASAAGASGGTAPHSGFVPEQQQQQQQQQLRSSNPGGANGSYSTTAAKQTPPVQLYTRSPSAGSVHSATLLKSPTAVPADSGSSSGLTWQQLEQQQQGGSSSTAVRGGSGFWDGPPSMSTSPPPSEWWDSSSSSKPKPGFSSSMPRGAGAGLVGAEGSGSRAWSAKTTKYKPDGWAEEEQEDGFWDAPLPEQQPQPQQQLGLYGSNSNSRSQTPNHLASSTSGGNGYTEQQQHVSSIVIGFGGSGGAAAAASAPVGSGLPPTPSTGLLKRAGGAVQGGTSAVQGGTTGVMGSTGKVSSGALAALLAGAVAKTAGSNSSNSPAHQHGHHRHTVSGTGSSSALQQLQHQLSAGAERHRTPSPGLSGGRQQDAAYDRHQQHHELQIAMAQRQQLAREASSGREGASQESGSSSHEIDRELRLALMQQRLQEKEAAAAKNSASATDPEDSGSARQDHHASGQDREMDRETKLALMQQRLQAKEAAAAAAHEAAAAAGGALGDGTSTPSQALLSTSPALEASTGVRTSPRRTPGPEIAAAARLFTRATAEAVADTSHAAATATAVGVSQDLMSVVVEEQQQAQQQQHGGVVILQAPPVPHWLVPEQQQQQQQLDDSNSSGGAALAPPTTPQVSDAVSSVQQQQQEEECLIDEETGEVIILKPKSTPAAAAALTEDVAAAEEATAAAAASESAGSGGVATEQLLRKDECLVDGSSSSIHAGSALQLNTADMDVAANDAITAQTNGMHGTMDDSPLAVQDDAADSEQQRQQEEELISIGLQVRGSPEEQQQRGTYVALEQDVCSMQEQLVHLHLSIGSQQQQLDEDGLTAAAAMDPVSTTDSHGSQFSAQLSNGATALQPAEDGFPLRPGDPQVSAAAAIAAAALAATAEELLNELPGADQNLGDQPGFSAVEESMYGPEDQAGFEPEGFPAQREPSSSELEPPSPGPYTPLSPVGSSTDQDDVEGLGPACFEGEGLSSVPGNVDTKPVQSGDDDFVAKLVRRVSGGAMIAPDLNHDLNWHAACASAEPTAAAAAAAAVCSVPIDVPPVLLDLGIPLAGIDGGLGVSGVDVCAAAGSSSSTWFGPRQMAGSPITAIEELGNVSNSNSSSNNEDGDADVHGSCSGRGGGVGDGDAYCSSSHSSSNSNSNAVLAAAVEELPADSAAVEDVAAAAEAVGADTLPKVASDIAAAAAAVAGGTHEAAPEHPVAGEAAAVEVLFG